MRDNVTWKLVEILAIRQAKLYIELVDSDEEHDEYVNIEKFDNLPVS